MFWIDWFSEALAFFYKSYRFGLILTFLDGRVMDWILFLEWIFGGN